MAIFTAKGNALYIIGYFANADDFAHYLPIVQEMVNSFQVIANNGNKSLSHTAATVAVAGTTTTVSQTQRNLWTSYNNSTYGVKIDYPSRWDRHNLNQEIRFLPPFENNTAILLPYDLISTQLSLQFTPYENIGIDGFVSNQVNLDKISLHGFKLVDFSAANLKGKPAYKVVYTYTIGQDHVETMEYFSVVGNTGYKIKYLSLIEKYPKYLQTAQNMIASLEIYKETRNLDVPGLRVGIYPLGLTINPDTNMLYVVNRDSRSVSAIDASTDRLLANVSVGKLPVAVTVNPNTKLLYVVDASSGTVSVIDGSTYKAVQDNIPTGHFSQAVTIDPLDRMIFVANSGSGTVSVINGIEERVIDNVSLGEKPVGVAVNPFTKRVYVTQESNISKGNVSVIDYLFSPPDTFVIRNVTSIPLRSDLNAIAVNPSTNMVYVTSYNDTLYAINGSTNNIVSRVLVGPSPNYVAVSPKTNAVYVTNADGTLSVINGSTNKVLVSNLKIGRDPEAIAVNPKSNMIYITHPSSGTISVINGTTNNIIDGISFNVNPQGSGEIVCGTKTIPSNNYLRYVAGTSLHCQANPNTGFIFGSWSGSYANSNHNSTTLAIAASKYGSLTANFGATSQTISLPKGVLDTLWTLMLALIFAPIASWVIPYIIDRSDTARQRKYLSMYLERIDKINEAHPSREEYLKLLGEKRMDITRLLEEGTINDSSFQILDGRISEYIDMVNSENKSSTSPSDGFISNISDSAVQKRIQKYTSNGKPV
jgi:YVTN family beta-propeller protein